MGCFNFDCDNYINLMWNICLYVAIFGIAIVLLRNTGLFVVRVKLTGVNICAQTVFESKYVPIESIVLRHIIFYIRSYFPSIHLRHVDVRTFSQCVNVSYLSSSSSTFISLFIH